MTDNSPTAKIAADDLPTVAWSYIPSDAWNDIVLTNDPKKVEIARELRRKITPLVRLSDAQALIDRLTRELAEARQQAALQALSDSTQELGGYEVAKPDVEAKARAVITARDRFGWSSEVDTCIEALRAALEGKHHE